eukprot:9479721-Pyramimonas_sp.AAC.1
MHWKSGQVSRSFPDLALGREASLPVVRGSAGPCDRWSLLGCFSAMPSAPCCCLLVGRGSLPAGP